MKQFNNIFRKLTKKTILAILAILVIGIPLLYLTVLNSKPVSASWFNESWLYRQAVTITVSSSASDVTNLATKISVDTASLTTDKLQSDCDDLRFTNVKGDLLPFYIDSGCDTSTTKIWVMVDLVPKNTTTYTMYMYYGNPSAVSASTTSNGLNLYQGLAAYWNMNESAWDGTAAEIKDLSGNANNSARVGDATTTTGKFGNGGTFDGSGDYINAADSDSLNVTTGITNKITVSAWVKRSGTPSGQQYFVARWNCPCSYILGLNSNTTVMWVLDAGQDLISSTTLTAGTWYHVVGTYDGSNMRLYINGVQENSKARTGNLASGAANTQIGRHNNNTLFYNGVMDDVRIYNRDLSATEVSQLYNDSASSILTASQGQAVPTAAFATEEQGKGPVGYWAFDDGTGQTAQDASSSNNDGTLGADSGSSTDDPTWQTEDRCVAGKCLYFDGTDDNFQVTDPSNGSLDFGTNNFTISAWVRSGSATNQTIVSKRTSATGDTGYRFRINSNGNLLATITDVSSNQADPSTTGANVLDNKWHHVVLVVNRTSNTASFYVDGTAKSTTNADISTVTGSISNSVNFRTGYTPDNLQPLAGFIDDVKIYPYARTAAQVKTDYNAGKAAAAAHSGTSAAIGSNPSAWISDGLVGYWKMDDAGIDAEGETITDSSGNSNTGTLYGDNSTGDNGTGLDCTAAGKYGSGCSLDGTDDYISVADSASLDITGDMTVSMWVNPGATQKNYANLLSKHASGAYTIEQNNAAANQFYFSWDTTGSGDWTGNSVTTTLTASTWQLFTIVKSGATVTHYVNGAQTATGAGSSATISANNVALRIGDWSSGSGRQFNGSFDEIRVYNRALSSKEVSDLYNWAPGPVGYWKMDDHVAGDSKTVVDASGNANNGSTVDGANNTGMNCNTPGKYGGGCSFDGTDDYISIASLADQTFYKEGTVSFWSKLSRWGATDNIYGTQTAASNVNSMRLEYLTGNYRPIFGNAAGDYDSLTSNATASLNTWTYITVTWDQSSSGTIKLYLNGVLDNSKTSVAAYYPTTFPAFVIGAGYSGRFASGVIDDFKIYNYARTQKQIVSDMNAGHPAVGSPVGSAIGYWKFDEGYGDTTNNSGSAGSVINGNLQGTCPGASTCPSWTQSGKFGKALSFDGGDYLLVPHDASINFGSTTSSFTLSAWFKTSTDFSNTAIIAGKDDGNSNYFRMHISSGEKLCGSIWQNPNNPNVCSDATVNDNAWHQGVLVRDVSSDKIYLYLDGALVKSATDTTTATFANSVALSVGSGGNSYTQFPFTGSIDEVRLYSYALTADELKLDYNRGSSMQLGALGTNPTYERNAANQEYCVPGDTTSCAAPVARWDFEEGTGGSVNDTSGNGNTGTWNGTGSHWTNGRTGKAGRLNGSNDYVNAGNNSSLDATTGVTIEAWFNSASTYSEYKRLIFKRNAYSINFNSSLTSIEVYDYISSWRIAYQRTSLPISPNTWYHIVYTYDGTTHKLYLNGVYYANSYGSPPTGNLGTTTNPLYFGGEATGEFNGSIDQVRVFNYARSAAQVAWDYNRGAPVGWWKMDECQGGTAYDSSGNKNNGTITIGASGEDTLGTCTTSSTAWGSGATGKRNSSLNFDGTDDYINITDNSILRPGSGDWSVGVWAKPANSDQTSMMVGKRQASGDYEQWGMSICGESGCSSGGQQLQAIFRTSSTSERRALSSADVADGNWHHYTMVVSQSDNKIKLYKDGMELATSLTTTGSWPTVDNTDPVTIGDGNGSLRFSGQIDDVRVYNYALTATQVKDIMNQGAIFFGPVTGSP